MTSIKKMENSFVTVNGVPTHIVTFGGGINNDMQNCKEIVLCIPGNPGVTGFYLTFLETLNSQLGIPVWMISHAGHELPPKYQKIPPLKKNPYLYDLEGQVQHKIDFIKRYVPPHVKIHFVGHSIGSKIILEIMDVKEINSQVSKCYLLFPTIERMAETPNGKFLTGIILKIVPIICFLAWIFTFFPRPVQKLLVFIYFAVSHRTRKESFVDVTVNFIHPVVLKNVFFMAEDEMVKVKELDTVKIRHIVDNLILYYGAADGWSPTEYCNDLKKKFPRVKAEISQEGYKHAFVLNSSKEVADLVTQWIEEDRKN